VAGFCSTWAHLVDQALLLFGPVRSVYAELDDAGDRPGRFFLAPPHSLNVVTSWNLALDATIPRRLARHAETPRASRGDGSLAFQKPGDALKENGVWSLTATAGPY
jgi:hypothetical protein